jgi:alpha-beta hydrolase superfamily lysophospholipase
VSVRDEGRLAGAKGVELFWQAWLPEGEAKAVVGISHGVSEHSGRYGHVGERFAAAGYAVYAVDHRGHGRSEGARAMIERTDYVVEDLHGLIAMAAGRHPGLKVFLLGHSMGGAVALAYAIRHQDELAGLLLSGPLASVEAASPVTRAAATVLSTLTPRLGIYDVDSSAVSRDTEVVRAYERDPLVYHGKLPARTVSELTGAVNRFPGEVPSLRLPLLVMHGDADTLTPVDGSRMVHERAGSSDKTLELLDGLYHEILNEPEREQVMTRMVEWLNERA